MFSFLRTRAGALLGLAALLAASTPTPLRAADQAVVTCYVRIDAIVDLPQPGVHAMQVESWSSEPLSTVATLYTASKSYTLDLRAIAFEQGGDAKSDAEDVLTPFRTRPILFRLPAGESIEAATLDFGADSACLTSGYAKANASAKAADALRGETSAVDAKLGVPLEVAFKRQESQPTCAVPYRRAQMDAPEHLHSSDSVPREQGTVVILVGLTSKGDVSSLGLLGSNVSRPFEGAALHQMNNRRFEPEIFRCEPVAGGLAYHFHYRGRSR